MIAAPTEVVVVGVVAAAMSALGAYLLAAKRMSGRIDTSTATELWKEAGDIREDYRMRLANSAERMVRLEARIASLEMINAELLRENLDLKTKVDELQELIGALNLTITKLQTTIAAQTAELKEQR